MQNKPFHSTADCGSDRKLAPPPNYFQLRERVLHVRTSLTCAKPVFTHFGWLSLLKKLFIPTSLSKGVQTIHHSGFKGFAFNLIKVAFGSGLNVIQ